MVEHDMYSFEDARAPEAEACYAAPGAETDAQGLLEPDVGDDLDLWDAWSLLGDAGVHQQ